MYDAFYLWTMRLSSHTHILCIRVLALFARAAEHVREDPQNCTRALAKQLMHLIYTFIYNFLSHRRAIRFLEHVPIPADERFPICYRARELDEFSIGAATICD